MRLLNMRMVIVSLLRARASGMKKIAGVRLRIARMLLMKLKSTLTSLRSR